jgi:predicted nucleotidyltransferase
MIINVFKGNPSISSAVVFGSRAKGNYSPYSDVDIALYGNLDLLEVESVICDLNELSLIYKFDIVAFDSVKNPMLREHIGRVGVVIYEKE